MKKLSTVNWKQVIPILLIFMVVASSYYYKHFGKLHEIKQKPKMQKCLSVFHTNGSLTNDLQWELAHCKLKKRLKKSDNKKSCLKQRHIHKLSNQFLFFGDSTVKAKAMALAKFFKFFQEPCTKNCTFKMVPNLHWEDEASSTKIDFLMNPYLNPYFEIPNGTQTVLFGGSVWFTRPPEIFAGVSEPYYDLKHLPIPKKLEIHRIRFNQLLKELTEYWKIETIIWILPEPMRGELAQYNHFWDAFVQQSLQVLSKYEDKVVIWSSWAMFFQQLESKGLGNIMPDGRHVKEEFQLPGMQPLLNFLCNPVDPSVDSQFCCHNNVIDSVVKKNSSLKNNH